MGTFLQAVHVLAAVLLIGPLVFAPFAARRAIARREAAGVWAAARQLTLFGAGSVLVAVFGALTLVASDEYGFGEPWVVISMTLFVVALGLVYFAAVPALRGAARLLEHGVLTGPVPAEPVDPPATEADDDAPLPPPTLTATADDLRAKEQLDGAAGRVTLAGLLVGLVFAVIAVLMVVRPFS